MQLVWISLNFFISSTKIKDNNYTLCTGEFRLTLNFTDTLILSHIECVIQNHERVSIVESAGIDVTINVTDTFSTHWRRVWGLLIQNCHASYGKGKYRYHFTQPMTKDPNFLFDKHKHLLIGLHYLKSIQCVSVYNLLCKMVPHLGPGC